MAQGRQRNPMRAARASCVASTDRRGLANKPVPTAAATPPEGVPKGFPSRFGHNSPHWTSLSGVHDLVAKGVHPKTTPEDFRADLDIFGMIMDALKHEKRHAGQEVH